MTHAGFNAAVNAGGLASVLNSASSIAQSPTLTAANAVSADIAKATRGPAYQAGLAATGLASVLNTTHAAAGIAATNLSSALTAAYAVSADIAKATRGPAYQAGLAATGLANALNTTHAAAGIAEATRGPIFQAATGLASVLNTTHAAAGIAATNLSSALTAAYAVSADIAKATRGPAYQAGLAATGLANALTAAYAVSADLVEATRGPAQQAELADASRTTENTSHLVSSTSYTAVDLAALVQDAASAIARQIRRDLRAAAEKVAPETKQRGRLTRWQITSIYIITISLSYAALIRHALPDKFAAINDLLGFAANLIAVLAAIELIAKRKQ